MYSTVNEVDMGGIKPPPDYHRRLNRAFMKRVLAANFVIIASLVWFIFKGYIH